MARQHRVAEAESIGHGDIDPGPADVVSDLHGCIGDIADGVGNEVVQGVFQYMVAQQQRVGIADHGVEAFGQLDAALRGIAAVIVRRVKRVRRRRK